MDGKVITCVTLVATFRSDNSLAKEEFAFVSDLRKQDSIMTEAVTRQLLQIFKERGLDIRNIIFKSDNCGTQFKSKQNFSFMHDWTHKQIRLPNEELATLSCMSRIYGVAMHGKCECDALGALIGNTVTKARLAGQDVDTAAQIVNLFTHGYKSSKTKYRYEHIELARLPL